MCSHVIQSLELRLLSLLGGKDVPLHQRLVVDKSVMHSIKADKVLCLYWLGCAALCSEIAHSEFGLRFSLALAYKTWVFFPL